MLDLRNPGVFSGEKRASRGAEESSGGSTKLLEALSAATDLVRPRINQHWGLGITILDWIYSVSIFYLLALKTGKTWDVYLSKGYYCSHICSGSVRASTRAALFPSSLLPSAPFPLNPLTFTRWMGTSARSLLTANTNTLFSLSIGIRRSAFEKLAALAVKSPARDDGSELARLAEQSRSARPNDGALNGVLKGQAPASRVPMVRYGLASLKE